MEIIYGILVSFWWGDAIAEEKFLTHKGCETYVERVIAEIPDQHIHNKNNGGAYEIHVDNGDVYFAACVPVNK